MPAPRIERVAGEHPRLAVLAVVDHGVGGACREAAGCVCPAVYQPVCGQDGKTYSNGCAAGCANMQVRHDGECGIDGDPCDTDAACNDWSSPIRVEPARCRIPNRGRGAALARPA